MKIKLLTRFPAGGRAHFAAQILITMTRIMLLLIVTLTHVAADGFSQKISFHARKQPIQQVLKTIERQSGYLFLYDEQDVPESRTVTARVRNASLDQVLETVFRDMPVSYKIFQRNIVVKRM
jgi:type II secretory pathway component GspD/PulD (secretin)